MMTVAILLIAALIFAWGWHRLYAYNMRKGVRPLIGHMLGFLLGIFPAQFFVYACFASFPPPEIEPPSTGAVVTLWIIFIVSVVALFYLTSRPVPGKDDRESVRRTGPQNQEIANMRP